jgi:hypothetical protein
MSTATAIATVCVPANLTLAVYTPLGTGVKAAKAFAFGEAPM